MAARAGYDGPRGAAYIWIKDIHIDFRTSASVLAPGKLEKGLTFAVV